MDHKPTNKAFDSPILNVPLGILGRLLRKSSVSLRGIGLIKCVLETLVPSKNNYTTQPLIPKENTPPATSPPFPSSAPGLFSVYPYSPTNEANRGR